MHGLMYAEFMNKFANALHSEGMELSVDYFSNLAIWNLPAMNSTALDTIISMDTYVQDNSTMEAYTQMAMGYLDFSRFGVGVCPQNSSTEKPYGPDPCGPQVWSAPMIKERLDYLLSLMASPSTQDFIQMLRTIAIFANLILIKFL
eukprot:m.145584 g.145584  ORF g.145584 m.145584 type:complete len:146 (-) comp14950_c0_seq1:86-523(-)